MPFNPLSLIPFAGEAFNMIQQSEQNRKSREWQEKMYGIQRKDALSDFQMQNEYNSPSSQMQRLRDAKLNPNLVYGNGATSPSVQVRSSDTGSWNPTAPRMNASGAIGASQDIAVKQATTDNLKEQNNVLKQEALLKAAQVVATVAGTDKTKMDTATGNYDLQMKNTLQDTIIEGKKADVEKTHAETKSMLDENDRKAAMQAPNLKLAVENILNARMSRAKSQAEINHIKQQITNLQKDATLKDYEIQLNKEGIQKGDPLWLRGIVQWLRRGSAGGGYNPNLSRTLGIDSTGKYK